jgi:hypothetical protein
MVHVTTCLMGNWAVLAQTETSAFMAAALMRELWRTDP